MFYFCHLTAFISTLIKEISILEETGDISVTPKADKRPVQPADLGLKGPYMGFQTPLILDGQIADSGLNYLGKDRKWLISLLDLHGIHEGALDRISLATLDGTGKLHVDYFGIGANPGLGSSPS